jgi:mono/diheme cytochrome c family protein
VTLLKRALIAIASIVALLVVAIYAGSEYKLRTTFEIPATPVAVPTDSAGLARGRHIFETRGCEGCHGAGLAGNVFLDEPLLARLIAPNVVRAIRDYSDPELARLIRHGVRPNGRGVAVMPSSMFYNLDDADLGALIAYLRTLPDKGADTLPATSMRILARVGIVTGKYNLEPVNIIHDAPRPSSAPDRVMRGEYIARSSCTECHGSRLEGRDDRPALSIVRGYSAAEFARLMREGVPRDGRQLTLMARTAKNRFVHLSDDEVSALYEYLSRPPGPSKS